MKKALFFGLIFLTLTSCKQQHDLPDNTSEKVNSVSVIIDDLLWNGEIGDSIRNKFASPVLGLPQEEPLFTINQYPVKLLEGYKANSRNIIIVKKGVRNHFEITQDERRKPQTQVKIYARTSREVIAMIEEHASEIIRKIHREELLQLQKMFTIEKRSIQRINAKFGVALKMPKSYKLVVEAPKFMWFKNDITGGNTSIVMYQAPFSSITVDAEVVRDIIKIRDSVGKQYIHGSVPNTYMITEDSYSPYFTTMEIANKKVFETKGTWQLDNDFMMGSFINYCFIDREKQRIIIIEGFAYAPSVAKRDLMLELEAIIKTVKFNSK